MLKFCDEFAFRMSEREVRRTQEMDSRDALRAVHHTG